MKRSEMVSLMAKVMEENFDGDNGSWEQDAEKVLSTMENAGIAAPSVPARKIRGDSWRWGGGCTMRCNCDECNPVFPMHQWEKE